MAAVDPSLLNVLKLASGAGGFSTLAAVLELAGMDKKLSMTVGGITILAPTDAAFEALGPKIVQMLMAKYNRDYLQRILLQHVIAGDLPPSVLLLFVGGTPPLSLLGSPLPVTQQGLDLFLGGGKISLPNIPFSNQGKPSSVYVIDKVMIPSSKFSPT